VSTAGPAVHLVAANVSQGGAVPSGQPIQLFFDRLLLPQSISRQTFVLTQVGGTYLEPTIGYDPVARVVSVTPITPLDPCLDYELAIVSPQSSTDPNGLRAIDGALLARPSALCSRGPMSGPLDPCVITFGVKGGESCVGTPDSGAPATPAPPTVAPCAAQAILAQNCGGGTCHGGSTPAEGLELDTAAGILATAVGRVAQESNTGGSASPAPPTLLFAQDMPIVDEGNPGNSWLLYKLLLSAAPSPCPPGTGNCAGPSACPGFPETYSRPWSPLSAGERGILSSYVQGSAMPYPYSFAPVGSGGCPIYGLSTQQLEVLDYWILEGAPVSSTTCP